MKRATKRKTLFLAMGITLLFLVTSVLTIFASVPFGYYGFPLSGSTSSDPSIPNTVTMKSTLTVFTIPIYSQIDTSNLPDPVGDFPNIEWPVNPIALTVITLAFIGNFIVVLICSLAVFWVKKAVKKISY